MLAEVLEKTVITNDVKERLVCNSKMFDKISELNQGVKCLPCSSNLRIKSKEVVILNFSTLTAYQTGACLNPPFHSSNERGIVKAKHSQKTYHNAE